MQTAVQAITETTPGSRGQRGRVGTKGKQAGGFAALLSALFGKGGQAKGMAAGAAGDGFSLKGGAASAKKGHLPEGPKGKPNQGPARETETQDEATLDGALLAGLAAVPLVPAEMIGEATAGLADPRAEGAEKGADLLAGRGAKVPPLKGGMAQGPFQAGGASGPGRQPEAPGEMGVDRFAAMVRGATEGTKNPGKASAPSVPSAQPATPGSPAALSDAAPADGLAGAKTGGFDSRMKAGEGKGGAPVEAALADPKAGPAGRKEAPLMAGNGPRSRTPRVEEPADAPLRRVKPVAVERAGTPVTPLTAEAAVAVSELESLGAAESPKSGLTRQLALQVGRQIATALKKNDHEVSFQVRPPSLGRLQINIEREGERVSVRIVSEKEKAGEVLAAGKHELRALMADHGIRLDRIEVASGSPMDFAAQGDGTQDRSGRGRSSPQPGGQERSGEANPEAALPENKGHDGAISVMV